MPLRFLVGALSLVLLALAGCAWLWGPWPVYPVTTGFHSTSPRCGGGQAIPPTYAVWSANQAVSQYITGFLLQQRATVVERARLHELFKEQKLRLSHSPDLEADLLRVGRLAGVNLMIFADVSPARPPLYEADGYTLSVSVRSVHVESGEVCWSGTASTPERIMSPFDQSAIAGAHWAIQRALCPVESGYAWQDPGPPEARQGCQPTGA